MQDATNPKQPAEDNHNIEAGESNDPHDRRFAVVAFNANCPRIGLFIFLIYAGEHQSLLNDVITSFR